MAIRYEDIKDDGARPPPGERKAPVRSPAMPAGEDAAGKSEEPDRLPFAKPVKPEKKRKTR